MKFYCVGESSCADSIARCYLTQKPSLGIPCWGEIVAGHAPGDELVMAFPGDPALLRKVIKGLEGIYKTGHGYPIGHAGADISADSIFRREYLDLFEGKKP